MKKYRIITNGEKFKAQARCFVFWGTLQKNAHGGVPPIMRDIVFDSYSDAESAAIKYLETRKKETEWWVADRDPDHYKKQGRPEPDQDLMS